MTEFFTTFKRSGECTCTGDYEPKGGYMGGKQNTGSHDG